MSTAIPGFLTRFMGHDHTPGSMIYNSPVGQLISYAFFQRKVAQLNQELEETGKKTLDDISEFNGCFENQNDAVTRSVKIINKLERSNQIKTWIIVALIAIVIVLSIFLLI